MESFLTSAGYLALITFAFVEACCAPISSEVTFGFAGVLAYQGHLNLALVIIIGGLFEVAGASLAYAIGRAGGRPAVTRFGKYVLVTQRDIDRAERFFGHRGAWSVAVGRILPFVRAFTGLVSGIFEVPAGAFEFFNVIGTFIYCTALALAGYALGSTWSKVQKDMSTATIVIVVLVVLVIIAMIALRLRELRNERAALVSVAPTEPPGGGTYPTVPEVAGRSDSQEYSVPPRRPGQGTHRRTD